MTTERERLKKVLSQYVMDGKVRHHTDAEEGVMVWTVI